MDELALLQVALRMSRERLLGTLERIGAECGWTPEVLRVRGRPGGPHIGWHMAHVACIEDVWGTEYLGRGAPRRPDLVHRFFRGTVATDDVPPAAELLEYLDASRRGLLEGAAALGSLDHPCRFSDGRVMPARDLLSLAPVHESLHHGRIAALFHDAIRGGGGVEHAFAAFSTLAPPPR